MVTVQSVDRISKRRGGIFSISADATAAEAAKKMKHCQIGCLLALDCQGKMVGIVSERDIVAKIVAGGADVTATKVEKIMSKTIVSCPPGTPAHEAQRIMATHGIRHLPILVDGVPVGMVSSRDIMAQELSAMRAVVQKQSKLLQQLEEQHPGITRLDTDRAGRVVI